MTARTARRLVIHGQVQGVWFRESMRREAERLRVTGWVRNRSDGTVEAAVEGSSYAVEAMIRWAQRGPEAAVVSRVDVAEDAGNYAGFEKRPTG
jgi:acylphosphatase